MKLQFFAVYSGAPKSRGHLCIARAKDKSAALAAARSNGLILTRSAYAHPLTVQQYADHLRSAGVKVSGVPEQLTMMECFEDRLYGLTPTTELGARATPALQ